MKGVNHVTLTTSPPTSAQIPSPATAGYDPRRWKALPVVLSATFMSLFDIFVVNVAAPSIQHDLHASSSILEMVVAGYSFSYAAGLVTGARLGDLVGRRRMFTIGLGIFAVASLIAGISPDSAVLVAARLAQGFGAAAMIPQVLALLTANFSPEERPRVFSLFGVTVGLGTVARSDPRWRLPPPGHPGLGLASDLPGERPHRHHGHCSGPPAHPRVSPRQGRPPRPTRRRAAHRRRGRHYRPAGPRPGRTLAAVDLDLLRSWRHPGRFIPAVGESSRCPRRTPPASSQSLRAPGLQQRTVGELRLLRLLRQCPADAHAVPAGRAALLTDARRAHLRPARRGLCPLLAQGPQPARPVRPGHHLGRRACRPDRRDRPGSSW